MAKTAKPEVVNRLPSNNGAPVAEASVKGKAAKRAIVLPDLEIEQIRFRIVGTKPLMIQKFSEKARKDIAEGQSGEKQLKPKQGRNPLAEALACREMLVLNKDDKIDGGVHGFPAANVKAAMCYIAADLDGISKAQILRGIHINPVNKTGDPRLSELHFESCVLNSSPVVQGKMATKVTTLRYRPEYFGWSFEIIVEYERGLFSPQKIFTLMTRAGFSSGLGENRVSRAMTGTHGCFKVETCD